MDKKRQHQFLIKFCCVFASFCLWLYIYNVVNPLKNYKVKDVPVELINVDAITQSKLALVSGQKFYVNLTLTGTASEVYRATPEKFKVIVDMSKYVLKKGEMNIPVEIIQYPKNVNVESNGALFVSIKLDDLVEKTVSVKVNIEGKPKVGYYAFTPVAVPNHVVVSGSAKSVSDIKEVQASGNINNMDKDSKMVLSLKAVNASGKNINEVEVNPKNIEVTVPIKKIKTVGIDIKTKGRINGEKKLKTLVSNPDKVNISGDDNIINNITSIDTEEIDLSKIDGNETIEVKLKVPNGVKFIENNDKVKVKIVFDPIIEKKISLDINFKNLIDGNSAVVEPTKVSLVVSGNEHIIKNLKNENIECFVDLKLLALGEYELPVKVTLPDGVSKVSVSPQNVKVTINKK